MEEEYRPVVGYEDRYEISNLGNFRNINTNRVLKPRHKKDDYFYVCVSLGSRQKYKTFRLHRLIAKAFIFNPEDKPCVNHIDGNKLNNRVDNLEWCTIGENNKHAIDTGLKKMPIGTECSWAKLKKEDVYFIRANYKRRNEKFGNQSLAKRFNVSKITISNIVNNKSYNNI